MDDFELNDDEIGFCDDRIAELVGDVSERFLANYPGCEFEIDREVRFQMICALENFSPYGRL